MADQVPDDVLGKKPSLWIIGGQEFDDAEPVLLILPVRLEIVFVLRSQDRKTTRFREFWFKTRDTQTIHRASVPLCSLLQFTGHYGATGALQLLRDPICCRPFTAVTRVQIPSGTPNLINNLHRSWRLSPFLDDIHFLLSSLAFLLQTAIYYLSLLPFRAAGRTKNRFSGWPLTVVWIAKRPPASRSLGGASAAAVVT